MQRSGRHLKSLVSVRGFLRAAARTAVSVPNLQVPSVPDQLQTAIVAAHLANELPARGTVDGSFRYNFFSVAASILAVSVAAGTSTAYCDSPDEDLLAALAAVKRSLLGLWQELDLDAHRREAGLPQGSRQNRLPPPQFQLLGDQLSVKLQLPPGARPLDAVLWDTLSAVSQCGGGGVSDDSGATKGRLLVDVLESGMTRVLHIRAGGATEGPPGLWALVVVPRMGAEGVEVEFFKKGGLTVQETNAIGAVLLNAAKGLQRAEGQPRPGGLDDVFGSMERMLRQLPGGGGIFGAFPEELRSMFPQDGEVQGEVRVWRWPPLEEEEEEEGGPTGDTPWGPPQPPAGARRRPKPPPRRLDAADRSEEGKRVAFDSEEGAQIVTQLELAGARVYPPTKGEAGIDWGMLAGYEDQKRAIEDSVLLALQHPEVYNSVARGTRKKFASNRPRAVLFEGPPGCGKTTSARVIAQQAGVALVYVPLEAVVSKWYGESERSLSDMLKRCEQLDGCILFLDELDALVTSRGGDMHEATRRILGVLLRFLDGFESSNVRSVVVGATNRKQDLDPALLSRFDTTVRFDLPTRECRKLILQQYAQQLSDEQLEELAAKTEGMSGRDLRDICELTERRWASRLVKGEVPEGSLPELADYMVSVAQRSQDKAVGSDVSRI